VKVIEQWTGGQADALRRALRMTLERFAERVEMSPRQVANWRKEPEIIPRTHVQRALDSMLESASDRVKAQFALLMGEELREHSDNANGNHNEPFEIPFDAMTKHEWSRDDANALSLSFDSALSHGIAELVLYARVRRRVHGCRI
jgi:transcriptional regulator with XRE-family HTH domain